MKMKEVTLEEAANILCNATGLNWLECADSLLYGTKGEDKMYGHNAELCPTFSKYAKQNIYISDSFDDYHQYRINSCQGRKFYID
jgi:hypothetical protein